MNPIQTLAADAARHLLWNSSKFPGRWRVQRWAERRPVAYAQRGPRRIAMNGFEFLVEPRASFDVYLNGVTRDSAIERILRAHVEPGATALDVGANIGFTARLMSMLVGDRGAVHAFEPIPAAFANLRRNAEAAPLRNISCHQSAASDAVGEVALYLALEDASALATMRAPDAGRADAVMVPTLTLDSLAERIGRVDFVKIDVEGAEHKVLLGMEQILRHWRPTLAIELSDAWLRKLGSSSQGLLDHLLARGYRVLACEPGGFVPLVAAPAHQVDVVCIARD